VTRSRRALALVACAGAVLAACSSPSTPKVSTTTTHASVATTSSSTTTSTPTSTSTTPAASAACNSITASAGQSQGAAGTITGVITVTNTGSSMCTADGYPKVALLSGSGAPLTVTIVNGLSVSLSPPANAGPSVVSVAPSSTAQLSYQYSDVPVGTQTSCPMSETASVTMPGATTASPTFTLAIGPCDNGTIKVSPVYAPS
jgi:ABC-type glycerol-3-phosphate transport system substrate-binding protein